MRKSAALIVNVSAFLAISIPGLAGGLNFPTWGIVILAILPWIMLVFTSASSSKIDTSNIQVRVFVSGFAIYLLYLISFVISLFSENTIVSQATPSVIAIISMQFTLILATVAATLRVDETNRKLFLQENILSAMTIICLVQVFLIFIGIENAQKAFFPQTNAPALLSSVLGHTVLRQLLPMASGMHNALVAPLILLSLCYAGWTTRRSWRYILLGVLASYILIIVDSRTSITAVPIAILLVWLFKRFKGGIVFVGLFLPIIMPASLLLKNIVPEFFSITSARYDTFGLYSGREYIWASFTGHFSRASFLEIMFGNGGFSQATNGVSSNFSFMFANWSESGRELVSLHNSYFQVISDTGLLGLSVYMFAIATVVYKLVQLSEDSENIYLWKGLIYFTLAYLLVASSEVVLTPYTRESFGGILMIFLLTAAVGYKDQHAKKLSATPIKRSFNKMSLA